MRVDTFVEKIVVSGFEVEKTSKITVRPVLHTPRRTWVVLEVRGGYSVHATRTLTPTEADAIADALHRMAREARHRNTLK